MNQREAMTEATGFEARTIHRVLEVDRKTGGFRRGAHRSHVGG